MGYFFDRNSWWVTSQGRAQKYFFPIMHTILGHSLSSVLNCITPRCPECSSSLDASTLPRKQPQREEIPSIWWTHNIMDVSSVAMKHEINSLRMATNWKVETLQIWWTWQNGSMSSGHEVIRTTICIIWKESNPRISNLSTNGKGCDITHLPSQGYRQAVGRNGC
jgi:hypothetical protein